jgi:hypothetical protein
MTYVTRATRQFAKRQAVRQVTADMKAEQKAARRTPPMREPTEFETPLSPQEVEQGVRDGTFTPPGEFEASPLKRQRDMQAGPGTRYVTKGSSQ